MSSRPQYHISSFHDHPIQWLVALFCTKPELYKDHARCRHKQNYFFDEFRKFVSEYRSSLSEDEQVYFGSVRKEVAGEANICGGGGRLSGPASRYFKNRHHGFEELREKQIDQFAKRYGVCFEPPAKDPRLFLGVTEIWNKLDQVEEIIAASNWANVRNMSYDDESFAAPFPKQLEKELVPLAIRNKTMQKFRDSRHTSTPKTHRVVDVDQEELDFLASKEEKTAEPEPCALPQVKFVAPSFDDDEW
jgi:hypothetical protein